MLALAIALITLALVGHAAIWVSLSNRCHSIGWPRWTTKAIVSLFHAALVVIPAAVLLYFLESPASQASIWQLHWATAYIAFCAVYGAMLIPRWALWRWRNRRLPEGVQISHQHVVDVPRQLGYSLARGPRARMFSYVPGNQLCQLQMNEFSVGIPRLSGALDGLSICHWSDLHLSGRIDPEFYREIVRLTNTLDADLIALTGDVCDKARCIDWIPEMFGPAKARLGKFFVLGNHDLRVKDIARLRGAMREAGFTDLGGRQEMIHGGQIAIAGDERPWFKSTFETAEAPGESRDKPLKILLSHTPDRLPWARAQRFDLMLAGHTHGGQICFPAIGPIACPSWHGVKYAAGFFYESPTLLYVSRGTGSLLPLRINCPPEITKLVLHRRNHGPSA